MSQHTIHTTLARSYLVYFIASIVGLYADMLINIDVALPHATLITMGCFGLGALLIFWAQFTSRGFAKQSQPAYFFRGPYRYMRNPTHLGLVLLVMGYTVVSGSVVFCALTLVGYLISNVLFQKYEAILDRTYGPDYQTYKTKVPKIF